MKFQPPADDVPVIGLSESGPDMDLTIAFIGSVQYQRHESEDVARLLDQAAAFVRQHGEAP